MEKILRRQDYTAPKVEVVCFRVEQGYALSALTTDFDDIITFTAV